MKTRRLELGIKKEAKAKDSSMMLLLALPILETAVSALAELEQQTDASLLTTYKLLR